MMTYEEEMFVDWVNQTSAYDSANVHQRWMKDAYVAGYQKASKNYSDELETKSQEWEKALDALEQRWEDASRCVPEPYLNVLVVDATNPRPRYDVGYVGSDGVWKGQNSISSVRVTHWQLLPGVEQVAKIPEDGGAEIRATFIVNENLLAQIKSVAYWERDKIKDVLDEALKDYLEKYRRKNPLKTLPKGKI